MTIYRGDGNMMRFRPDEPEPFDRLEDTFEIEYIADTSASPLVRHGDPLVKYWSWPNALDDTLEDFERAIKWYADQKLYATFEFKCHLEERMQELEHRRAYVEFKYGAR